VASGVHEVDCPVVAWRVPARLCVDGCARLSPMPPPLPPLLTTRSPLLNLSLSHLWLPPQILPFWQSMTSAALADDIAKLEAEVAVKDAPDFDEALDAAGVDALRNFHKKFNKVLLDKLALERERSRLAEEQEGLKSVLQQVGLWGFSLRCFFLVVGMCSRPREVVVVAWAVCRVTSDVAGDGKRSASSSSLSLSRVRVSPACCGCCWFFAVVVVVVRARVYLGCVQYLAGVSVGAASVDGPNPLLVVNSRTSIAVSLPVRAGHVPVVEMNHMVGTGRVAARR
jgi:hypothetical protein